MGTETTGVSFYENEVTGFSTQQTKWRNL